MIITPLSPAVEPDLPPEVLDHSIGAMLRKAALSVGRWGAAEGGLSGASCVLRSYSSGPKTATPPPDTARGATADL